MEILRRLPFSNGVKMRFHEFLYVAWRSSLDRVRTLTSSTPVKYGFVGLTGQGIDFLLTILLVSAWIPLVIANTIGYISASVFTYYGHTVYTFSGRSTRLRSPRQLTLFALTCLVGAGLGSILLVVLVQAHIPITPAKIIQLAASALSQYLINQFVTFRKRSG